MNFFQTLFNFSNHNKLLAAKKKIFELEMTINELQLELELMPNSVDYLIVKEQLENVMQKNEELEDKLRDTTEQLKEVKDDANRIIEKLKKELSDAYERFYELKDDSCVQQIEYDDLIAEHEELQNEFAEMEEELDELNKDYLRLAHDYTILQTTYEDLTPAVDKLINESLEANLQVEKGLSHPAEKKAKKDSTKSLWSMFSLNMW